MRPARLPRVAIIALLIAGALGACTTEKSYEGVRRWARDQCERESSDPERAACLKQLEDDYETFEAKRREAMEEQPAPKAPPGEPRS